jgi:hypothetical protein|tara:strand:+ start:3133 stop:3507 length:375 start_codon:yes stop_codon:yes gene_type:complete
MENQFQKQYEERKWSTGESYKRSPRTRKIYAELDEEDRKNIASAAQQQSLLSEDDWSNNQSSSCLLINNEISTDSNKREDSYDRMAQREMMGQCGLSPFSTNTFSQDMNAQEDFLKPKNTNLDN